LGIIPPVAFFVAVGDVIDFVGSWFFESQHRPQAHALRLGKRWQGQYQERNEGWFECHGLSFKLFWGLLRIYKLKLREN
jgi:hypothetical protein